MMICWSPHQERVAGHQPSRYLLATSVRKSTGASRGIEVRSPAPERLLGHPAVFQRALAALSFKKKYRVATLSCALQDVDVDAFNAGHDGIRLQAAGAIQVFIEAAFAGIPDDHRPPLLVGTHTHTGRLEINIAMPRFVVSQTGMVRSFNPHPPMTGSTRFWDAVRDMINHHYGWQSPLHAPKTGQVRGPDWLEKDYANAIRLEVEITADASPRLYCLKRAKEIVAQHPNITENDLADHLCACGASVEVDLVASADTSGSGRRAGKNALHIRLIPPQQAPSSGLSQPDATAAVTPQWVQRGRQNVTTFSDGRWSLAEPDWDDVLRRPTVKLPICHPDHAVRCSDNKRRSADSRLRYHLTALKQALADAIVWRPVLSAFAAFDLRPLQTLRRKMEALPHALTDIHRTPDDRSRLPTPRGPHVVAGQSRHPSCVGPVAGNDPDPRRDGGAGHPAAPDPAPHGPAGADTCAARQHASAAQFHDTGYRVDLTDPAGARLSRGRLIAIIQRAIASDAAVKIDVKGTIQINTADTTLRIHPDRSLWAQATNFDPIRSMGPDFGQLFTTAEQNPEPHHAPS